MAAGSRERLAGLKIQGSTELCLSGLLSAPPCRCPRSGASPRAARKHNCIGTEHLLLGLLRKDEGLAARVLESLGITVERVRRQVVRIFGAAEEIITRQIPSTQRAKKMLELALHEALTLGY